MIVGSVLIVISLMRYVVTPAIIITNLLKCQFPYEFLTVRLFAKLLLSI